jgi:hypothetical protein
MIPPDFFNRRLGNSFTVVATLHACAVVVLVIGSALLREPHARRTTEATASNQERPQPDPAAIERQHSTAKPDSGSNNEPPEEDRNLSQTIATWVQAFDIAPGDNSVESVFYILTDDETASFRRTGVLKFAVAGWIHFEDAFGEIQNQPFGKYVEISDGNAHARGLASYAAYLKKLAREWPFDHKDYETDTYK